VQPPVGAVAAPLGQRRAVDQPDDPALHHRLAAQLPSQHVADDLLQPRRATAQALERRNVRQLAQAHRVRPRRHRPQRHPARTVGQRKTQQIRGIPDLATAKQCSTGLRRRFQFLDRPDPAQQLLPTAFQLRCIQHLDKDSHREPSCQPQS